jgi:hypothetical protein
MYPFILSFLLLSVLREVLNLFQSEVYTVCDILLPLSITSILSFRYGNPVAAYFFFVVCLSPLFFLLSFLHQIHKIKKNRRVVYLSKGGMGIKNFTFGKQKL